MKRFNDEKINLFFCKHDLQNVDCRTTKNVSNDSIFRSLKPKQCIFKISTGVNVGSVIWWADCDFSATSGTRYVTQNMNLCYIKEG